MNIEESQLRFMDSVNAEEPMTRSDLIALSLYWIAACVLVGLAFYGAVNLAEVVR